MGAPCGLELVRSTMRELNLQPGQPRPWRLGLTEQDDHGHRIPDLLEQDCTADAPGKKLIGDITYIPTWEGCLYLATVIDCHRRIGIGYLTGDNYKNPLVAAALNDAARNVVLDDDAIFHSDGGSNYTSHEFTATIEELGPRRPAGRTGICHDNAMTESFFTAFKNERADRTA